MKRLRFMVEKVIENGKEVVTNGNRLGVGFKLKNYKCWLSKIGVVVHRNKMAHPQVEKSNFLCMNLQIVSCLNKGVETIKPKFDTIC